MGKHISESLCSPSYLIMSSDDDQPAVMDLYVGFDFRNRLVVCADYSNYDQPSFNCSTAAVVDIDDAHEMARRNGVRYRQLPFFIADCMERWGRIVNAGFGHVEACFKEITECLLDEGCRFRIERTCGSHGFFCF